RDAAVMFRRCDDVMLTGYSRMDSDTLASVVHFDLAAAIAYPHRLSRIDPRHRVPVAFPRNVGIARHFAQLFFHVWVRRTSHDRVEFRLLFCPSLTDVLVGCSVYSLIADFSKPTAQVGVQVFQIRRLLTL